MDEELELAAMEQMMGLPGMAPAGGEMGIDMGMGTEPTPPGYTMVFVPDAVLPAVMELVAMSESGGALDASAGMDPGMGMGMGPGMGMDPSMGMPMM
jgi:hypothetical protein